MKLKVKYVHGIYLYTGPCVAYPTRKVLWYGEEFSPVDEEKAKEVIGQHGRWLMVDVPNKGMGFVMSDLVEEVL